MAIIIETCPKCGHDLHDLVIATNPPIPQKKCFCCGWEWTGEPEEVVRVPFGGNSFNHDNLTYALHGNMDYECINVTDYCMANNSNRSVFTVSKADLDGITGIDHDAINEAIERVTKYLKGK